MTSEINDEVNLMTDTVSELSEKLNDYQATEHDEREDLPHGTPPRKLATANIRRLKAAQRHLDQVKIILQAINHANQ